MKRRIGLALGSGSARGWAHIGVIRALHEAGIVPDLVCGCSIGALVGAAYADGDIDALERWVTRLRWQDVSAVAGMALLLSFVITIWPARNAARMNPVEALRYE